MGTIATWWKTHEPEAPSPIQLARHLSRTPEKRYLHSPEHLTLGEGYGPHSSVR
jgi:hypothetical protein